MTPLIWLVYRSFIFIHLQLQSTNQFHGYAYVIGRLESVVVIQEAKSKGRPTKIQTIQLLFEK
jgi:hypothetical protein